MLHEIEIAGLQIGPGHNTFIIAELSANHNHEYSIAEETIHAMKESGADAVKLQTYLPDTLTIDCDNEYFRIKQNTLWDGMNLYQLYKQAYTPWEWQPKLKELAESLGMICFSTPFDNSAVDFLEEMDVPAYKIASFEIQDINLIRYVASKQKPIIISTGVATKSDIELAMATCRKEHNNNIILLKCTSAYPAPVEEANLRTISDMSETFGVVAGLSDHTLGIAVPVAAVSLGASVIEKHFILDKKIGGPDATFSLDPYKFKEMVDSIRDVERALGRVTYELSDRTQKNKTFARSLFIVENIKKGEIFSEKNVKSIRPGYGLHPKYLKEVIGKKSKLDIDRGTPLSWEFVS